MPSRKNEKAEKSERVAKAVESRRRDAELPHNVIANSVKPGDARFQRNAERMAVRLAAVRADEATLLQMGGPKTSPGSTRRTA